MKVQFTVYKNAAPGTEVMVEIPDDLPWYEAREEAMRAANARVLPGVNAWEMGASGTWQAVDGRGDVYTFLPHWPEELR